MRLSAATLIVIMLVSSVLAYDSPDKLVQPKNEVMVQASLERTISAFKSDEVVKAWVFFTDKGFFNLSEYDINLQSAENALTERAKKRRLKARGLYNLVDFHDIPVYKYYIEEVVNTGAKLRRTLRWFNAVTIEADVATLNRIAQLPFIHKFKPVSSSRLPEDYTKETKVNIDIPLVATTTLEYGMSQLQLEQINTTVAHELGFAGQDVLVCMLDTGYKIGHIAFQDAMNEERMLAQYDFINNDDNTDYDPSQDGENQARHGTLCWSALGGQSAGNLYGPAYQADFILGKTEDTQGEYHGEEDNWAAAAEWADSLGADVISTSLGYRYSFDYPDEDYEYSDMNGDNTIVTMAADMAVQRGISVAAALGNDGSLGGGSLIAPADGDSVIGVGAVNEADEIASFSAWGPTYDGRTKPDISARGVSTVCADPSDLNGFSSASGTSLSTPLVGGALAVLLSAHPNWTPMMVLEALKASGHYTDFPDNHYGWGILDVGEALFYHPEGDIIVDHEPMIFFPAGLDNNIISAIITGGADINNSEVYLYWRTDYAEEFIQSQMIAGGEDYFEAVVPGLDEGFMQYYIYAEDVNGIYTTYPYGGPDNFLEVQINSTEFFDSFENGLYYWMTEGTFGNWSVTAERSATGNVSVADSPYRNYYNDAELTLTSKFKLDLYDAEAASVSFEARHILQTNLDMVYFEVSTDDGVSWEAPGPVITGSQFNFAETEIDLADYLGSSLRFRFRMVTDGSSPRDGINIDDFYLDWEAPTDIADGDRNIPQRFSLNQNYPNPFNPSTIIGFSLAKPGLVNLDIYDLLGKKVKTLQSGNLASGGHEIIWDGTDDSGDDVASGVYLYKLDTGETSQVERMTLLR
ncbi:MAG: S8 family serine peptidase [candidate division Zixibacteria bacterium]|nr:S8 family serine peptidase [candidate division Zixibacteria bacterium]